MNEIYLRNFILECVRETLNEAWYTGTATPYHSKSEASRELGRNPLRTDVGGHSASTEVRQPSTFDRNGENFRGENIVLSDNKFTIYKIKNFGNPDIKETLSLFGQGAAAEIELRRAIDTVNGAADRNGKSLSFRTITSESNKRKSEQTGHMRGTFWEFSFDGHEWFLLKPNPVQTMKPSKLVRKTDVS